MAHVISFSIAGLAGRTDVVECELSRDLNVFYGVNGSGKTSLLRILDSAMTGDAGALWRVPFESARVAIFSIQYNETFVFTIDRTMLAEGLAPRRTESSRAIERPVFTFEGSQEIAYAPPQRPTNPRWAVTPADDRVSSQRWAHVYLPSWRAFSTEDSRSSRRSLVTGPESSHLEVEYYWDTFFANRLEELWVTTEVDPKNWTGG